jgi:hypothetical protein
LQLDVENAGENFRPAEIDANDVIASVVISHG